MKLTVLDNVISEGYQNYLSEQFTSNSFAWYYTPGATCLEAEQDKNTAFSSLLFLNVDERQHNNPGCDSLFPLLFEGISKYKEGAELKFLYRIKAGMFVKNQTDKPHIPHVDLKNNKHYTLLYYVIDSDGPTKFYNGDNVFKQVDPKKGRAVIFPGDIYHASASPRQHPNRITLNINFLI